MGAGRRRSTIRSFLLVFLALLLLTGLVQPRQTLPLGGASVAQAAEFDPGPTPPPLPPLPEEQRQETHVDPEAPSAIPDPEPKGLVFKETPQDTLSGLAEDPLGRQENAVAYQDQGTNALEVFGEPVSFKDDLGAWKPIDAGLTEQFGGGFKNVSDSFTVDFPKELGPGTPVTVTIGSGSYTFVPHKMDAAVPVSSKDDVTLVYPKVLSGIDLTYTLINGGFREATTVASADVAGPMVYDLSVAKLTLELNKETGEVSILDQGQVVAVMPVPFAVDSSVDPETGDPVYGNASYDLLDLGGGSYQLTVTVDADFLKGAKYPVTIDPGQGTLMANKDTWTENGDTVGHVSDTELTARDPSVGAQAFSYLYFNVSSLIEPGRDVLSAHVYVYGTYIGDTTKAIVANEITATWPSTLYWSNRPNASTTEMARLTRTTPGWFDIDATSYYQAYFAGTATNRGMRISSDGYHRFASVDNADPDLRPRLVLSVNSLPSAPSLNTPEAGVEILHASPTLRVHYPVDDPDGDQVKVQYQVADDPDFENNIVYSSWWVNDEDPFTLPSGILDPGKAFYWRARSWDVCAPPDGMCADTQNNWPASNKRKITYSPDQIGDDPRWALYGESLGNGMALKVNEATGNLFLRYPLDTLATPIGPLDISLTYNNQGADSGMGKGWTLAAGPASDPRDLPVSLEVIENGDAVIVHFADGNEGYFAPMNQTPSDFYTSGGARGGVLHKSSNDSGTALGWKLRTRTGSVYTFEAGGDLDTAKPKTSSTLTEGFVYDFTSSLHRLASVTDPWERTVTFDWSTDESKLESIVLWDTRTWNFQYDATIGVLDEITNPEGGVVGFSYLDNPVRMITVVDGEGKETTIAWQHPDGPPKWQVASVSHPLVGATTFDYQEPYTRQVAAQTLVTDRRGNDTVADPYDYITTVDLDTAGMPIRIVNPAVIVPGAPGGWEQGVIRMSWDSNGNLECRRSVAANAVDDAVCESGDGSPPSDGSQTDYNYDHKAPFRLLTETSPGPDVTDPTANRQVTTHTYDEGITGLLQENFDSQYLQGIPAGIRIADKVDHDWGLGHPDGVSGDEHWAVRYTGFLTTDIHHTYHFRIYANDGVRFVLDDNVLADCFDAQLDFSQYNCGDTTTDVKDDLFPGRHAISVEFREQTGTARVQLKWSEDIGGPFTIIDTANFEPNLGAQTTLEDPLGVTTFTYDTDDHWIQHLPDTETRSVEGIVHEVSRTYEDDGTWWRQLTETNDPAGTFTNVWWPESNQKACLQQTVDQTGAVIDYNCDSAGRIVEKTVHVDAETPQPQQDRTTTYSYDDVSRPLTTLTTIGSITRTVTNVWDLAGRLEQTTDSWTDGTTTQSRTTDYEYDVVGRLKKVTYADPDGTGPLARPYVQHAYDLVGNEIQYTDANLKVWTKTYDALNRVVSSQPPVVGTAAVTTTVYDDTGQGTGATEGVPQTIVTNPHGVAATTVYDLLGRPKSVQLGTNATNYTYPAPTTTTVTDPTGVATTTVVNSLGQTVEFDVPDGPGTGVASTLYAHDASGRLESVTDALGRVTAYLYDDGGDRVTKVNPPDPPSPADPSPPWIFTYDDAGELIRIVDPDGRTRDSIYDALGRLSQAVETRNGGVAVTTTDTYDGFSQPVKQQATTSGSSGRDLRFEYDQLGRRTRRYCAAQCANAADEKFSYDPAGNMTKAEGITSNTKVDVSYDDQGRPSQVQAGTSTTVQSISTYTYDKDHLQTRADANGPLPGTVYSTTTYGYDSGTDRLNSMSTSGSVWSSTVSATYTYDAAGRPDTRTTSPGNIIVDRDYLGGRLNAETVKRGSTTLSTFAYTYDDVGNVKQLNQQLDVQGTITGDESGVWDYQIDEQDRLTQAKFTPNNPPGGSAQTTNYQYDWAGNRTEVAVVDQSTIDTSYDTAGLPISSTDGFTYSFDLEGNLTQMTKTGQIRSFTYDAWNRTIGAIVPSVSSITYAYDALDRQVSRAQGSTTSSYRMAGISADPVRIGTSSSTTYYAYGLSAPIAQVSGSTLRTYVPNLHGDLSLVTNSSGTLTDTQSYGAWGEKRVTTGTTNPAFSFQSDLTDKDTALVDMGARLYYPALGRFLTRDLLFGDLKDPISMNRYAYGADSPVRFIDPNGLCPVDPDNPDCHSRDQAQPPPSSFGPSLGFPDPSYGPDYQGKKPVIVYFDIPQLSGYGTVYGGFFIQAPSVWGGLRGDNRGFSSRASSLRYRAYFWLDFDSGKGFLQVNPTCQGSSCTSARSIKGIHAIGWVNGFDVSIGKDKSVTMTFSLGNSKVPGPKINDTISIHPDDAGHFGVTGHGDRFPSIEIYQSGNTFPMFAEQEWNPLGLFFVVPDWRVDGTSWDVPPAGGYPGSSCANGGLGACG